MGRTLEGKAARAAVSTKPGVRRIRILLFVLFDLELYVCVYFRFVFKFVVIIFFFCLAWSILR